MSGQGIDVTVDDHDVQRMADQLLAGVQYDHGTTLVCWHHGQILALAHAFCAQASSISAAWPDAVFGWLLRLDYDANGALLAARASNQQVMFDDQALPRNCARAAEVASARAYLDLCGPRRQSCGSNSGFRAWNSEVTRAPGATPQRIPIRLNRAATSAWCAGGVTAMIAS